MSAVEKKIKSGEVSYPLITFTLQAVFLLVFQRLWLKSNLILIGKPSWQSKEEEKQKSISKKVLKLALSENYLSERRIDYAEKQKQVRGRIDTIRIVEACGLVVGQDTFTGLIVTPANYANCMEKLLINHIRQRTMDELETSEGLIEAIYVSIKQTKIFRQVEATMEQFEFIKDLLEDYLHSSAVDTASFIHSHGQMGSQQLDIDDLTDIN